MSKLTASAPQQLQAATVIAKTTETLIYGEIDVSSYDYITVFLAYTNGDETGLNIYPYFLLESGGTEFQMTEWETSSGVYTNTDQVLQFTATTSTYVTFDVRGIPILKLYQGGSNNDGTPTGTLAVDCIMKG